MKHRMRRILSEMNGPARWLAIAVGLGVIGIITFAVRPLFAQQERLTILQTASNELRITITNAIPNTNYLIERSQEMNNAPDWRWHVAGTNSQTNFTVFMGIDTRGFFRAKPCTDCDNDGIPDWLDGDSTRTNVGALTITIESPLNNSTIY